MPFQPRFNAKFIRPIRDNLIALVKASGRAALDAAGADLTTPLPDFKMHAKSRRKNTQYPFLGIFGERTTISEGDDHISEQHEFTVEIALLGSDPEELSERTERYVEAVDSIIRSASDAEITQGLSLQRNRAGWEVTAHDYDRIRESTIREGQYLQLAQLRVVVQIREA
ncbi:MAG TPA: hypothetical protein VNQ79_15885 [Blastocatellia bacterium]|nr:hypothetical protein [Blastocatellia bacterium]